MRRQGERGVSLIEVLLVVGMVAVLASLAWPVYEHQLRRARRADALVASLQVQAAQERFRSHAPRYGALHELGIGALSGGGHYRLELPARDATGFELLAIATGAQARDASCRYMRLRSRQLALERASGPSPSVDNPPDANRHCWGP